MQAITVKYIGPSNTKPSRLKATAANGHSVTVPYSLPDETADWQGYNRAALALCEKLGWTGEMIAGAIDNGAYVYVFTDKTSMRINR